MADAAAQHAELVERFRALVGKHKAVQGELTALQSENAGLRSDAEAARAAASAAQEQADGLRAQLAEAAEIKLKLLDKARSLASHGKDLRLQLEECTATVAARDDALARLEAELVAERAKAGDPAAAERLRVRESQLESLHTVVAELQVRARVGKGVGCEAGPTHELCTSHDAAGVFGRRFRGGEGTRGCASAGCGGPARS